MVVPADSPWIADWLRPWGAPLLLNGLLYPSQPPCRGDLGLTAMAEAYSSMGAVSVPTQPWSLGFRASSVSVTFSRAGGVGSLIAFEVYDRAVLIGSLAGVNYPSGQTTVVIPVSAANWDLSRVSIINRSYPTGIDLTVNNITADPIVIPRVWTNYVKSQESV